MPLALIAAFVASLGAHALALFLPDVDLSTVPSPPTLVAEIEPVAAPARVAPPARSTPRKRHSPAKPAVPTTAAPPPAGVAQLTAAGEEAVPVLTEATSDTAGGGPVASDGTPPLPADDVAAADGATPANRLPAEGTISYRVYRGTRGLEVGHSTHTWRIADGAYRISALTETSGLAAFFKPLQIALESRGLFDAAGYHPESFAVRRNGAETRERADFDWSAGTVRVGDRPAEALADGAQDLLSFHYQLAFLPQLAGVNVMPIATGKKFERYRLEAVGDEEIETPAGRFQTLHVRAPGDNTTDLWLARERWLLPVKIRYTDRHGDSFEELADVIHTSSD
ncbi:DUF3108 domain-containing protein [Rhodocyclus tenuis]|uniref:DUF3108 domain-containing protein n=1 Tax=Rhodocyclus tenuis TaxID=1066 RepID=UPI001905EF89|nr:DUF3108 domain-containing protein [Rhodocyclus tenuis]MBK1680125.1 hypothetical protein [Rhodocyclus tenuis]